MGNEVNRLLSRLAPLHAASTIRLPRSRYMYFVSLFENLHRPSQRVLTADLANVVNGCTDVHLPSWAEDHQFEKEIEDFLDYDVCWFCSQCDSIVSFFLLEKDDQVEYFTRDFLIVFRQEKSAKCPYCGSKEAFLLNPNFFWMGEKAPSLELLDAKIPGLIGDRTAGELKTPLDTPTPHEALLEKVLREKGNAEFGEKIDELPITDFQIKQLVEAANAGVKGDNDFYFPFGDGTTPAELRGRLGLNQKLHPVYEPDCKNVLGIVWDEVKSIVLPEHPELLDVAVGVAKCQGLSASASYEPETGGMAIALEYGLQDTLYNLNHLVYHITTYGAGAERSPDELLLHMIRSICAEIRIQGPSPSILKGYRTEDAFRITHLLTVAQLQFILLHELSHLLQWQRRYYQQVAIHSRDSNDKHLAEEQQADYWAIERIQKCGKLFHTIDFQLFAVWWLFEFWHIADSMCTLASPSIRISRERWNYIEKSALQMNRSASGVISLNEARAFSLRSRIDDCVKEYMKWQATNMK